MAAPWEAYATPENSPPTGPWSNYESPKFGSDEYVDALSKKHGVKPAAVQNIVRDQLGGELLKGVPIAGAFVNKAGAALSAAGHPLSGVGAPGASFSERYGKNLDLENEIAADYERENPIRSTAAQLAGGTAATLPLAATRVAPFLGMVGGGLGRQVAASAASGAGISAADALARGNDVGSATGLGAGIGAAGPVAGRVIGAAGQAAGRLWRGGTPPVAPQNISRVAGVDVPLSSGQATGNVNAQMMENTALRGGEGQAPQQVAEQFFRGEQAPAVEQARTNIGEGFGGGRAVVDNPQAAGELVGERVREVAGQSRQNYQDLYRTALGLPGEIHASAFDNIGERIKGSLSNRQNPVIIDDVTTPIASRAIQDIDRNISQLRVQNRAQPGGAPDADSIVGINLQGVDQTRKRLTAMASATERGTADHRAIGQVIHEFDNHVEDSIANGLFTGDDRALNALRDARAAYSQHRRLFTSQGGGDDVGRAMERIVGRNGAEGATPNEVANWLYGSAKVGGTGLSVRLAQRMQEVLGANSPEWAGLRQGLWARLTQATEGTTEFGPARIANRISEFLNGSGAPLAQTMFTPQERRLMQNFMQLQQQLTPRPGTVNYSNTAPVLRQLTLNAFRGILATIGASVAGPVGLAAGLAARPVADTIASRTAAGRIARSLYQTPATQQTEERFVQQMGRYGALASRAITPHPDGQPRDFHPSTVGARQAADGQHYLSDPTRPGKYLRVDY